MEVWTGGVRYNLQHFWIDVRKTSWALLGFNAGGWNNGAAGQGMASGVEHAAVQGGFWSGEVPLVQVINREASWTNVGSDKWLLMQA